MDRLTEFSINLSNLTWFVRDGEIQAELPAIYRRLDDLHYAFRDLDVKGWIDKDAKAPVDMAIYVIKNNEGRILRLDSDAEPAKIALNALGALKLAKLGVKGMVFDEIRKEHPELQPKWAERT